MSKIGFGMVLIVWEFHSSDRRRSRRRPDGQEMRSISQLQSNVTCISSGQWSDEDSDLPPAKRPRDNTVISDYDDPWNQSLHDDRPIILTPPSMVRITFVGILSVI